ncbi:hypothetical protein LPUS_04143 [Lasallia pustulata]|uniref:SnoaL-like domain-containing protein n=1 Tax=Lasallia pustulata TaxID=136370 RepID=A0A1W5CWJ2_9LECA|nr:hypothetical protein LPUS_04143 [Lasallia pustulata]
MASTQQRQTANALITAFNNMDIPSIMALRAPESTQQVVPLRFNFPCQDNPAYERRMNFIARAFDNFHLEVKEVIEDVTARKIVMWLSANGDTKLGEYRNEYMWTMEFDESGGKIVKMKEFVDTAMIKEFYPQLRESIEPAKTG